MPCQPSVDAKSSRGRPHREQRSSDSGRRVDEVDVQVSSTSILWLVIGEDSNLRNTTVSA